ncbi:hypothetical protein CRE_26945 [Caenorhabditis remanei]|uniref:Uncharacterized protein n=1 Tax=Caenorhabditis remanei TaxID=31234 RepID=E3LPF0_CAERE|nr:hypothetical protein CRE_26945 [Caenorhabditis remanei]
MRNFPNTSCLLNMLDAEHSRRNIHVPLSFQQETDYTSLVTRLDEAVNNLKQFHGLWIFDKVVLTMAVASSAYISFFSPSGSPQAMVAIGICSFLVLMYYMNCKFIKWIMSIFHVWLLLKETE